MVLPLEPLDTVLLDRVNCYLGNRTSSQEALRLVLTLRKALNMDRDPLAHVNGEVNRTILLL